MGLPQPVRKLSAEEYLEIERHAEWKSEFFEGEMFAMAGASLQHNQIAMNLGAELRDLLQNRKCIVLGSDMRLKISADFYTYPDVTVVCGQRRFADNASDILLNPVFVAEVLSDSTEAYDRGKKFEGYRRIASLKEYLLISQYEARIEQYVRQPQGDWLFKEAAGMKAALELPALEVTLALSEVFAKVEFAPATFRPATPARKS